MEVAEAIADGIGGDAEVGLKNEVAVEADFCGEVEDEVGWRTRGWIAKVGGTLKIRYVREYWCWG
jgi:hypothetical protein